ncbi:unnamed protein product [Urochloa decumbens]|uniref:Exportin-5 C-terminal domain-containing protein n=1 Tax=Urochloa decumbens TaxID=240449 RepID=A0ABC9AW09_9POAL
MEVESAAAFELDPQVKEDEEGYVGLLVRVSLLLLSNDIPLEVHQHGDKMRQHLLKFRHEELSSADLLNLTVVELVVSPDENHTSSKSANAKEQNKNRRSLLVLAAKNNLRSLDEEETETDGSSHSSSSSNNKSGSTVTASNWCSSESSSSNNNVSCMGSFELSIDARTDCGESELEVQRLMEIDISDNEVDDGPEGQDDFADIVHPQMLRFYGKAYCHQLKGCLLLAEHNILCEAFVMICSRNAVHKGLILCVLNLLNMIWTQPEWENTFLLTGFDLSCLFSDRYFLKMVYGVVKLCENELKRSRGVEITEGQSYDTYFDPLLRLILPWLLQLLQCIHSLWRDQIACNLSEEIESAKMPMNSDDDFKQNETRDFLEDIRESGYKVVGVCMSIEGAFTDLLDKSSFNRVLVDLVSMEFRHLRKLIDAVFLPLVRNCPPEFWKEWMLNLLQPLLRHCESVLYSAWFSLMHKGRAKVPYYFGKLTGSAEDIEKLEHSLLLDFTRSVCHLFGIISSPESNNDLFLESFEDSNDRRMTAFQDLESVSSSSLIGFLLARDCFGRLRMGLFGYWVDDEASRNAIPFCRALVRLAGVTKDQRLELFVLDELLPSLIRRVDDQLPCAIRHLICKLNSNISDDVNKDLILLCFESYKYLSSNVDAESKNMVGEDKHIGNYSDNFMRWLAKQKKDLHARARHAAPNDFDRWKTEWNWEFEDEFRRYLPLYIGMLKEVDAIGSSKDDYSDWEILEKLNPEFRSKYAINSIEHHHFITILNMRRRQYYSIAQVRNHNQMAAFLSKIITIKPYIKGSDDFDAVINRLKNIETPFSTFYSYDVEESVHILLDSVLYFWEPQFHPLIREGHNDLLLWIIDQLTKGKEFEDFQPLLPDPRDFPTHLEPYALQYIVTKLNTSEFVTAELQLRLHQEYDNYLASGELDNYIHESVSSEEILFGIDVDNCTVQHKFSDLDHDLIKLSLKRRAAIVQLYNEVRIYSDCIRGLVADDSLKSGLTSLMKELEVGGFFAIDNELVTSEEITELVDRFRDEVFNGHSLPRHYVIRGIIDYRTILLQKDTWGAFKQVVGEPHDRLREYLPKFWRDTRHYKHKFYDIIRGPLEKIFVESLVPSDLTS